MKEQWRKAMQKKLEDYRLSELPLSWEEMEKGLEQVDRPAAGIVSWRRSIAAAVLVLLVGGTTFLLLRHHPSPSTLQQVTQKTSQPAPPVSEKRPHHSSVFISHPSPKLLAMDNAPATATHLPSRQLAVSEEKNCDEPSSVQPEESPTPDENRQLPDESPVIQPSAPSVFTHHTPASSPAKPVSRSSHGLLAKAYVTGSMTQERSSSDIAPMLAAAQPYGPYPSDMKSNGIAPTGELVPGMETRVHHKTPVHFGLSLHYDFSERWSIESGLSYTQLTSDLTAHTETYARHTRQTLSYVGIPVSLNYRLWQHRRFSLYASGGVLAEKMVRGRARVKTMIHNKTEDVRTEKVNLQRLQWSVNGAIGAEYRPIKNMGIYAEPTVGYYFSNGTSVPTVYQENPLHLTLNIGLRFHLSTK